MNKQLAHEEKYLKEELARIYHRQNRVRKHGIWLDELTGFRASRTRLQRKLDSGALSMKERLVCLDEVKKIQDKEAVSRECVRDLESLNRRMKDDLADQDFLLRCFRRGDPLRR